MFGMVLFTSALVTICVLYCFIGREIKMHTHRENVKRIVSLTMSMARKSDYIRPATISGSELFEAKTKNVRFGGARTVSFNDTSKNVKIVRNKSVRFDDETNIISKGIKFGTPKLEKKRKISNNDLENMETESSSSSGNTQDFSQDDTCDFDVPKRPMTRAQKTKSKRMRRAKARKVIYKKNVQIPYYWSPQ